MSVWIGVDGSFMPRRGTAGIGICGDLGWHARCVVCPASTEAEMAAIAWGLEQLVAADVGDAQVASDWIGITDLRKLAASQRKRHPRLRRLLARVIVDTLDAYPRYCLREASGREVRSAHNLARRAAKGRDISTAALVLLRQSEVLT